MSREAQQYAGRRLSYSYDDDGSLVIKARLPAETGAIVLAALEAAMRDLPLPDDLQRHLETARRLACDASVVRIVENGAGEPLDVGRKTRSIPPALRRALQSRDQGCVFPGCTHKRYVDGHHIRHWAEGGETRLSNLVSLCRFHHRAVHEGGIVIERLDDGAWRFVRPSGEALHSCAPGCTRPLGDWARLPAAHTERGIDIEANTAATRWRGERMDPVLAIDLLVARVERAKTPGNAEARAPAPVPAQLQSHAATAFPRKREPEVAD